MLIPWFSVYSGLPFFSAGLSVLIDRKNKFIYLLWKELEFLGVKEELTSFCH